MRGGRPLDPPVMDSLSCEPVFTMGGLPTAELLTPFLLSVVTLSFETLGIPSVLVGFLELVELFVAESRSLFAECLGMPGLLLVDGAAVLSFLEDVES